MKKINYKVSKEETKSDLLLKKEKMGGGGGKKVKNLKESEVLEFSKVSSFNEREISELYNYYKYFSATNKDDGVIDYAEFCDALAIPHSEVTKRIFKIFDTNSDSVLNFREFVIGLASFLCETTEEKVKLSFRIYDQRDSGFCSKDDVFDVLKSCLVTMDTVSIPDPLLKKMIDQQFLAITEDEFCTTLNYEQYRKNLLRNSDMLHWLQLDLDKVTIGAKLLSGRSTAKKNKFFCK
jgi:Ca2+-binding EF-hand superfamily protein